MIICPTLLPGRRLPCFYFKLSGLTDVVEAFYVAHGVMHSITKGRRTVETKSKMAASIAPSSTARVGGSVDVVLSIHRNDNS